MPWNLGDVVKDNRSIPASAFGGRSSNSTQLLIDEGSILGRNNSSNQDCRRILNRFWSHRSTPGRGENSGIIKQ